MTRPLPPSRFRRVVMWVCFAIGCFLGLIGIASYSTGRQSIRFQLWSVETKQTERWLRDYQTRAEFRIKNGWMQYGHNEEWAFQWWFVPKGRLHMAILVMAVWTAFGGLFLVDRHRGILPGHCA